MYWLINKQAEGLPLIEPPVPHPSTREFPLEVYKAVLYWAQFDFITGAAVDRKDHWREKRIYVTGKQGQEKSSSVGNRVNEASFPASLPQSS